MLNNITPHSGRLRPLGRSECLHRVEILPANKRGEQGVSRLWLALRRCLWVQSAPSRTVAFQRGWVISGGLLGGESSPALPGRTLICCRRSRRAPFLLLIKLMKYCQWYVSCISLPRSFYSVPCIFLMVFLWTFDIFLQSAHLQYVSFFSELRHFYMAGPASPSTLNLHDN